MKRILKLGILSRIKKFIFCSDPTARSDACFCICSISSLKIPNFYEAQSQKDCEMLDDDQDDETFRYFKDCTDSFLPLIQNQDIFSPICKVLEYDMLHNSKSFWYALRTISIAFENWSNAQIKKIVDSKNSKILEIISRILIISSSLNPFHFFLFFDKITFFSSRKKFEA